MAWACCLQRSRRMAPARNAEPLKPCSFAVRIFRPSSIVTSLVISNTLSSAPAVSPRLELPGKSTMHRCGKVCNRFCRTPRNVSLYKVRVAVKMNLLAPPGHQALPGSVNLTKMQPSRDKNRLHAVR